jgi:hypothetical protein
VLWMIGFTSATKLGGELGHGGAVVGQLAA